MDSKKKKILAVSGIALILVAVLTYFLVGWVKNYLIRKDPVTWIVYGINKTAQANTIDSTSTTKVKIDFPSSEDDQYSKIFSEFANNLTLKSSTLYDKKANQAYYDLNILYNNKDFINTKIYTDKTGIIICSPSLYSNNLYINWDDLNKLSNKYGNNAKGSIDIKKYESLCKFDNLDIYRKLAPEYGQFLTEKLDKYFAKSGSSQVVLKTGTVKCDNLDFNINSNQAIAIFRELIVKAADDPNVKALIKEKCKQYFDLVDKNNDYKKFGFTKNDVTSFWKNFDGKYSELSKSIKDSKDIQSDDFIINLKSTFKFDSSNTIRGSHYNIQMSSGNAQFAGAKLTITTDSTLNSVNEKIDITKLSKDGAVNLATADDFTIEKINSEIARNLQSLFTSKLMFK